ncbi:HTH domain-containing protein [Marispirochaeta sp.]|uniref:HTH domain-containing protein n=1 Tax=Marispirochaeta sp. TaxID=2038653 RepID=UPI0029C8F48F|nr:HTH domain-containing protein [Marispirochaeta sp.]
MKCVGKKGERLTQLELLLLSHPEGLRRAEIARRLGVHRATAGRYIDELSTRIPLWEQDFLVGIKAPKSHPLTHLGLLEALSFYLALSFFAEKSPFRFPEGAAAIRNFAAFIKDFTPALGNQLYTVSDSLDSLEKEGNADYWILLERIGEAWFSSQPVGIVYRDGEKTEVLSCQVKNIRIRTDVPGIAVDISLLNDGDEPHRLIDLSKVISVDYLKLEPGTALRSYKLI